jgi:hypothetical protein
MIDAHQGLIKSILKSRQRDVEAFKDIKRQIEQIYRAIKKKNKEASDEAY